MFPSAPLVSDLIRQRTILKPTFLISFPINVNYFFSNSKYKCLFWLHYRPHFSHLPFIAFSISFFWNKCFLYHIQCSIVRYKTYCYSAVFLFFLMTFSGRLILSLIFEKSLSLFQFAVFCVTFSVIIYNIFKLHFYICLTLKSPIGGLHLGLFLLKITIHTALLKLHFRSFFIYFNLSLENIFNKIY